MSTSSAREQVSFLVFSASLRSGSLNTRLAALAAGAIEANGGDVDLALMSEFDCPSYDYDVQERDGFPAGAQELNRRLQHCDGFVVSSPEFNASMPGALKNAIDWVSRFAPQPFNELDGLLLSASPSMVGAIAGCGRSEYLSSTSERASIRICSRSLRRTPPLMSRDVSSAISSKSASRRTSSTSSMSSRRTSTTHA